MLEIRTIPPKGSFISRIIAMVPDIAREQRNKATVTVAFLGATRQKLAIRTVQQKTTRIRKGVGSESAFCPTSSQRASLTSAVSCSACVISQRR